MNPHHTPKRIARRRQKPPSAIIRNRRSSDTTVGITRRRQRRPSSERIDVSEIQIDVLKMTMWDRGPVRPPRPPDDGWWRNQAGSYTCDSYTNRGISHPGVDVVWGSVDGSMAVLRIGVPIWILVWSHFFVIDFGRCVAVRWYVVLEGCNFFESWSEEMIELLMIFGKCFGGNLYRLRIMVIIHDFRCWNDI